MTNDAALAAQLKLDYRQSSLDPKTRALLDFAVQVTRDPHGVNQQTIAGLQQAGWTDEDLLAATHIIGFFNYYTRLADALGVEPEEFMRRPE